MPEPDHQPTPSYFSDLIADLDFNETFEARQEHIKHMLYRYINLKTMVAFIGSGCSRPLGYPLWNEFAKDILNKTVRKLSGKSSGVDNNALTKLKRYQSYFKNKRLTGELSAQVVLRECERALANDSRREARSKEFRTLVEEEFERTAQSTETRRKRADATLNPYTALLGMPIRRFVTTNYDMEIEHALHAKHKLTKKELFETSGGAAELADIRSGAITRNHRSFTQKDVNHEQLTRISLARCDLSNYMVFHCHGRMDDMDSCVITEEDFQEWYLREAPDKQMFNQTLDLLFGSNPILFIGYSLSDPDLTRWLRHVTANRPVERTRCPLFALQYFSDTDFDKKGRKGRWIDQKHVEDECDALYIRYGLHVIPVFQNGRGNALCDELNKLKEGWRDWWAGINLKPRFRSFDMESVRGNSYFHYQFDMDTLPTIREVYGELEKELKPKIDGGNETNRRDDPRMLVIIGDGGTGKSWSVQRFLQSLKGSASGEERNVLFWSSYYSNDVFTCIDRAVDFFDNCNPETRRPEAGRFVRLREHLRNPANIVVFDGVEKLLKMDENKSEGTAISAEVVAFFELLSDHVNCKSDVILTSRFWSDDFLAGWNGGLTHTATDNFDAQKRGLELQQRKHDLRRRIMIQAPRCEFQFIEKNRSYKNIDRQMCALLSGHVYCISLLSAILENSLPDGLSRERVAERLRRNIANTPPDRRIQRVIREAIKYANTSAGRNGLAKAFLERLSLFIHPISLETAGICFAQAVDALRKSGNHPHVGGEQSVEALLAHLSQRLLIQKLVFPRGDKARYTLHPTVKEYVFEEIHGAKFSSQPTLQLPGFTAASETVDPGTDEAVEIAKNLFEALCEGAKEAVRDEQRDDAITMCHGAFSMLRSRFCANTVSRWGDYRTYLKMVFQLYDTVKIVSKEHWSYEETLRTTLGDKTTSPLYPDELAWVYNEVGLTSSSMGNMLNTMAIWQQGYEINRLIDRNTNGRYYLQSLFNLGVGFIHFGRLNKANSYLSESLKYANTLSNKQLTSRITAYIGLVQYLQGDLESSRKTFDSVYPDLADNPRALSVFYLHHAEVLMKCDDLEGARAKIRASRYLAEASHFPDLIAYSRLTSANLMVKEKQFDLAQDEYEFSLAHARQLRLRRLESGTLSGLSRLAYELKDSELARQKAVEALKIANEFQLRLHQTQSLLAIGKALLQGGNTQFGKSFLETARALAKMQGYFLRMHEAESELQKHRSALPASQAGRH